MYKNYAYKNRAMHVIDTKFSVNRWSYVYGLQGALLVLAPVADGIVKKNRVEVIENAM